MYNVVVGGAIAVSIIFLCCSKSLMIALEKLLIHNYCIHKYTYTSNDKIDLLTIGIFSKKFDNKEY